MKLYLVQHGEAKTEAQDPQRGLTDDGRRTVKRIAKFLQPEMLSVDRIEHSEKLRARQTAEILAARLDPADGMHQLSGLGPNDDIEPMRSRLLNETRNLMLVGHLPYLSRLAARLLEMDPSRTVVQFQMGAVVRLDRDEAGEWTVRWVLPPELVRQA